MSNAQELLRHSADELEAEAQMIAETGGEPELADLAQTKAETFRAAAELVEFDTNPPDGMSEEMLAESRQDYVRKLQEAAGNE